MNKSTGKNFRSPPRISRLILIAVALLAMGVTQSAKGDTTYSYTGDTFAYIGGCCGVSNVSGSFTIPNPLAPDTTTILTPDTIGGTITAFDFTDGRNTWDLANFVGPGADSFAQVSEFSLTTGASGNILSWDINITDYPGSYFASYCPGCTEGAITTIWTGTLTGSSDGTNVYNNYDAYSPYQGNWPGVGTWSVVSTPEPTSALLLGIGILGLGAMVLRRKQFS